MIADREMTLTEAAGSLPGRPYVKKLMRWIRQGVWTGPREDRRKVHLEARKIGGLWYVTSEALERFIRELTPESQRATAQRSHQRHRRLDGQRRHERAMEYLRSQGFNV